jgi:hypothetical protein
VSELFRHLNFFFGAQLCNTCLALRPLTELNPIAGGDGRLVGFSCAGIDEPTEGLGI